MSVVPLRSFVRGSYRQDPTATAQGGGRFRMGEAPLYSYGLAVDAHGTRPCGRAKGAEATQTTHEVNPSFIRHSGRHPSSHSREDARRASPRAGLAECGALFDSGISR